MREGTRVPPPGCGSPEDEHVEGEDIRSRDVLSDDDDVAGVGGENPKHYQDSTGQQVEQDNEVEATT